MAQRLAAMLLLASAPVGATSAHAAVVSKGFEFTALFNTGAYDKLEGSFTLAFDDATIQPSLTAINFAIGNQAYTLANSGASGSPNGTTFVGGPFGKAGVSVLGVNDFSIQFNPQQSADPQYFFYRREDVASTFFASSFSLREVPAVPEPRAWMMMLVGFGAVAGVYRSRQRSAGILFA